MSSSHPPPADDLPGVCVSCERDTIAGVVRRWADGWTKKGQRVRAATLRAAADSLASGQWRRSISAPPTDEKPRT